MSMINQCDFRAESRNLTGTPPVASCGTAVAMVGDVKALSMHNEVLLVFGGCNEPVEFPKSSEAILQSNFAVYDDLYALDLNSARWVQVPRSSDSWPPARAFHHSGIVLREMPENPDECEMVGFYVAGGIHKDVQRNRVEVLSDVWLYSFHDGSWSEIPLQGEIKAFASAGVLAGFNQQLYHGGLAFDSHSGHTFLSGDLQRFSIREMNGGWKAVLRPVEVAETGASDTLKRAFHSGACLLVEPQMIRAYELGMYSMSCDGSTRVVLMFAGGLTAVQVRVTPLETRMYSASGGL